MSKELESMLVTIRNLENRIKVLENPYEYDNIYYTYTDDIYGEVAKKLHEEHGGLKIAYNGDAGIDLPIIITSSDKELTIWPNERELLHTGIKIQLPVGYYGRIVHRSSTEKKHRLRIVEGTIDNQYRGAIFIQAHNPNAAQIQVRHGHKYAQLIVSKINNFKLVHKANLDDSIRGALGFGSSGV